MFVLDQICGCCCCYCWLPRYFVGFYEQEHKNKRKKSSLKIYKRIESNWNFNCHTKQFRSWFSSAIQCNPYLTFFLFFFGYFNWSIFLCCRSIGNCMFVQLQTIIKRSQNNVKNLKLQFMWYSVVVFCEKHTNKIGLLIACSR